MPSATIHLIAAARPNFMKIAPLYHALARTPWAAPVIVHTGQHYDINMSDAFFSDLGLPEPQIHLGVGSGSHAEQTGRVMIAYEKVVAEQRPDMVVVVGDVNSTIACTLAACKLHYDADGRRALVAHLEAGLRSFDRTMPEEINRLATDVLADLLWTPSADGDEHLRREGIAPQKIERVGNIMIDSLEMMRAPIEAAATAAGLGLEPRDYGVVTLHRPANVDNPAVLRRLCETLVAASERLPLVFPVHPRTRKRLTESGLIALVESHPRIRLLEPLSYIRFMSLVFDCRMVLTDSGGIQEETTYLGIPCLTLRPNTERPITITEGTNRLCRIDEVGARIDAIVSGRGPSGRVPELWDGHTAERVVEAIARALRIDA